VVGLNTAIFTSGGGSEGIGFARPVNDVKKFIGEAREHGRVRIPWIGLWMREITPDIAESMNIQQFGVLVSGVDERSGAQRAGIKDGDRIVSVNNRSITRMVDWNRFVSNVYVGDKLDITLVRGSDSLQFSFVVEEFEETDLVNTRVVVYGIHVQDITDRLVRQYNLAYREGVVVTKVEPNSIGDRVGIDPGDIMLMFGNMRIHNKIDFQQASRNQRDMSIIIDRNGRIIQFYLGT
jgi:serine protease Do